jgi:hypothetical protein
VLSAYWVHGDVTEHLAEGEKPHQRVIGRPKIIGIDSGVAARVPRNMSNPLNCTEALVRPNGLTSRRQIVLGVHATT